MRVCIEIVSTDRRHRIVPVLGVPSLVCHTEYFSWALSTTHSRCCEARHLSTTDYHHRTVGQRRIRNDDLARSYECNSPLRFTSQYIIFCRAQLVCRTSSQFLVVKRLLVMGPAAGYFQRGR